MNAKIRKGLARRKRRIDQRLARKVKEASVRPVFTGTSAQYELSDRDRGIAHGGIGLIHRFAQKVGLIDAIDRNVNPSQTKFVSIVKPSDSPRPAFGFHADEWWAQGLMFGLGFTY